MHQPLVVKRTTKYLAWKCNAVVASTRIHFISFQGFYREYWTVQGLINDRGHLFRRDTHFILLDVKLFTAKLYIFRRKWWVFIFKVFEEKKKKKKKNPDPNFLAFYGRSRRANKHIFFFGLRVSNQYFLCFDLPDTPEDPKIHGPIFQNEIWYLA